MTTLEIVKHYLDQLPGALDYYEPRHQSDIDWRRGAEYVRQQVASLIERMEGGDQED